MSRCKNCLFWVPFDGSSHGLSTASNRPPATKSRACTLRLKTVEVYDEEDNTKLIEVKKVPSQDPKDAKGKHHGERTGPKHTCNYVRPKHAPFVNPKFTAKPAPVEDPAQ